MYNRAELKSSDHRPVFALFKTVVGVVDGPKRDALARLLLENVTSISSDENPDERLAALTLHPSANNCGCLRSTSEFCDLRDYPVPPPSSEDNAWWDRPGLYPFSSRRHIFHSPVFHRPSKPLSNSPSKWCLYCYGRGGGTVPVDESVRFTLGFSVVIFPFVIRRRAAHCCSAGPFDPCSDGGTHDREKTTSVTVASEQALIVSRRRVSYRPACATFPVLN